MKPSPKPPSLLNNPALSRFLNNGSRLWKGNLMLPSQLLLMLRYLNCTWKSCIQSKMRFRSVILTLNFWKR
uniref:Uncharacterized protein n=1 Tax=Salix viminalis TaxID=40686 RepID=A0A6N2K9R3_SALVM